MIKSNELREGNLLLSVLTQKYVRVGWLQIKHVSDGNIQSSYDTTPVYEPIPLSAEILEKAGFTTDEMKVEYGIGLPIGEGADLFIEDEGLLPMSCGIKSFPRNFNYFKGIRYLHQLQNLYFALTGEELPVKL